LSSKNLTLMAYGRIKEMMLNYDIIPGQRLVFVDLAKQLGVSRTPVNNALTILAKEGFLDFVPNQGYSVHKLTREEAESLYVIREIIETGTIGKAIGKLTSEKLNRIEEQKNRYEQAISDRVHRKLFIIDTEFHSSIIHMIGNMYLADYYMDICQRIFLRIRTEDLRMERITKIVSEHRDLLEAIKIRDVEWAKEIIKFHNKQAQTSLFAIIFKDDDLPAGIEKNN